MAKNVLNDNELVKKLYHDIYRIRFVEEEIIRLYPSDVIKSPVHLSIGQESISVGVCNSLNKNDTVFGTYRGHALYLAKGGSLNAMMAELFGKIDGCCQGKGGSMHLIDPSVKMMGTSAVVASSISEAVGYALGIKYKGGNEVVVCFFGDGAAEEDYVLASMGFAVQKKLNIIFICDDNNLSVLTPTSDRRTWKLKDVASSFGIKSFDITDDPLTIYYTLKKLKKNNYPALLNIRTCREYWHEGAGKDKQDKYFWNRYEIVKKQLLKKNENNFIIKTEKKHFKWAKELWEKRLQKL